MKNKRKLQFLIVLAVLFGLNSFSFAQEKSNEAVLTNSSVVELVKAGISESIILTKIKNSKCEFDTSSSALVKLKENNVSENIIVAMIEASSKIVEDKKTEGQKTAEMKEAVGKRKIFLISEDEEGRIELVKKLTEKGFSFVDNKNSAELIFELTYAEANSQQKAGIFKGGNETNFKSKIGKLVVKINRDSNDYLIYAREYDYAKAAFYSSAFGISAAPPSLREQVKYYFVNDFLKQMKKAGDKIK